MPDEPEKPLRIASFAAHSARGLLRNAQTRRKTMFAAVVVAMLVMFAGFTVLAPWLNPHEYPVRFILYWLACAWVTVLALLLAIFDMLLVHREGRAVRKQLRREISAAPIAERDDE